MQPPLSAGLGGAVPAGQQGAWRIAYWFGLARLLPR